jgi:hypothetical protein
LLPWARLVLRLYPRRVNNMHDRKEALCSEPFRPFECDLVDSVQMPTSDSGTGTDSPSTPQNFRPVSTSFPHSVDMIDPPFQHFDEDGLFTSLHERVDYLRAFLDFTHDDVEALNDIVGWPQAAPGLVAFPHAPAFLRYPCLNRSSTVSSTKSMHIFSLLTSRNQLSCPNQKMPLLAMRHF